MRDTVGVNAGLKRRVDRIGQRTEGFTTKSLARTQEGQSSVSEISMQGAGEDD